jgi:hypothetical protein
MKNFIKVTRTEDCNGGEIWISKYQIIYMEADDRHAQTLICLTNNEIKVTESISDILSQIG